jgi:hypothetical protein
MIDGELRELGEGLSQFTGGFVLSGGQASWKHVGTIVMDAQSGKPGNNDLARAVFQVNYARVGKWRNKRKDSALLLNIPWPVCHTRC